MNLIDWIFAGVCINLTRKKEASSNFPRVSSPDPKEGRKKKIEFNRPEILKNSFINCATSLYFLLLLIATKYQKNH